VQRQTHISKPFSGAGQFLAFTPPFLLPGTGQTGFEHVTPACILPPMPE